MNWSYFVTGTGAILLREFDSKVPSNFLITGNLSARLYANLRVVVRVKQNYFESLKILKGLLINDVDLNTSVNNHRNYYIIDLDLCF